VGQVWDCSDSLLNNIGGELVEDDGVGCLEVSSECFLSSDV